MGSANKQVQKHKGDELPEVSQLNRRKLAKATSTVSEKMPTDPKSFVEISCQLMHRTLASPTKAKVLERRNNLKRHSTSIIANRFLHKKVSNFQRFLKRKNASSKCKTRQLNTTQKSLWKYRVECFMTRDCMSKALPGCTMLDPRHINLKRKQKQKKGLPVTKRVLNFRMCVQFDSSI